MRESGAEGSEGCGKLRGERHSHVISERETQRERTEENEAARGAISGLLGQTEHQNNQPLRMRLHETLNLTVQRVQS